MCWAELYAVARLFAPMTCQQPRSTNGCCRQPVGGDAYSLAMTLAQWSCGKREASTL
jgi:hypothetical protein